MTRFHHQLMQVRYPHLQPKNTVDKIMRNFELKANSIHCKHKLEMYKISLK